MSDRMDDLTAAPRGAGGRESIVSILMAMHTRMLVMGYSPSDSVRVVLPRRLFVQVMQEVKGQATYAPTALAHMLGEGLHGARGEGLPALPEYPGTPPDSGESSWVDSDEAALQRYLHQTIAEWPGDLRPLEAVLEEACRRMRVLRRSRDGA